VDAPWRPFPAEQSRVRDAALAPKSRRSFEDSFGRRGIGAALAKRTEYSKR
jgi:hypothetical protein